jgi:methyl-accepting chemotaxis protein
MQRPRFGAGVTLPQARIGPAIRATGGFSEAIGSQERCGSVDAQAMESDPSASPDDLAPDGEGGGDGHASRRRRFRFGMVTKSTIATLIVGLVPLALFGAITLVEQGGRIRRDAGQSLRSNAERIASQVDEWVDKNVRVLQAAAGLPSIAGMQHDDQTKVVTAIKRAYPWMYLVFTISSTGANVARSDTQPLVDYGDRQYFKDVVAGNDLAWESVVSKTTHKPALILAVPIRVNGATVGVLAAGTTIEDMSRIVVNWKTGSTGYAFLVDEHSKVIAHPIEEYAVSQRRLPDHPLVAAFVADGKPHFSQFSDQGAETLGYVQGNRFRWAVAVQQGAAELFAPQRQTLMLGLSLLFGAAALVVVTAVLLSKMLVRPVVEMTHAADKMSMGELEAPIEWESEDELGLLASALERLRKSMKAVIDRM